MAIHVSASNVKKAFNRRTIFRGISFTLHETQTLLIAGRNGSGKSTLVKIIAGVLSPSEGTIQLVSDGVRREADRPQVVGLVSPYLQMYDEFTATENLQLALALRGLRPPPADIERVLQKVSLGDRKDDPVRTYSSGMKQRVKYAFALVHKPPLLILDEPMANLDGEGVKIVKDIMTEQREIGALIVATNDLSDVDAFDLQVDLNAAG